MNKMSAENSVELLSIMSHEVKNLLNIITAACGMVSIKIDDKDKVLTYTTRISDTAEKIALMIDKNLEANRKRYEEVKKKEHYGGKYLSNDVMHEECFDINRLNNELSELLRPLAEEKEIDFCISSKLIEDETFIGDYVGLLQVLINLITNSIKYTPVGGEVLLRLEEVENLVKEEILNDRQEAMNIKFICKDNGIGMSEEFLKDIFKPFAREGREVSANEGDSNGYIPPGTGLGMSIVKEIVDTMGGDIHIESRINAGTTVIISLKLKRISENDD